VGRLSEAQTTEQSIDSAALANRPQYKPPPGAEAKRRVQCRQCAADCSLGNDGASKQ
jgi:hypothetical protein